jgi:hypothetical protein
MPDRSTLIKYLVVGGIAVVLGLVLWRTLGKKDKFLGYGEDYEESDEEMFEDEAEDYEDSSDEEGFEDEEESYEEEEDYEDGDDDTYA